jgi:hypothetical protein
MEFSGGYSALYIYKSFLSFKTDWTSSCGGMVGLLSMKAFFGESTIMLATRDHNRSCEAGRYHCAGIQPK